MELDTGRPKEELGEGCLFHNCLPTTRCCERFIAGYRPRASWSILHGSSRQHRELICVCFKAGPFRVRQLGAQCVLQCRTPQRAFPTTACVAQVSAAAGHFPAPVDLYAIIRGAHDPHQSAFAGCLAADDTGPLRKPPHRLTLRAHFLRPTHRAAPHHPLPGSPRHWRCADAANPGHPQRRLRLSA